MIFQLEYPFATPAEKAKSTRYWNKLWKEYEESYVEESVALKTAMSIHAPIRDAKIEEARKQYEEIVERAKMEFDYIRVQANKEFNEAIKVEQEALNVAQNIGYSKVKEEHAKFVTELMAN